MTISSNNIICAAMLNYLLFSSRSYARLIYLLSFMFCLRLSRVEESEKLWDICVFALLVDVWFSSNSKLYKNIWAKFICFLVTATLSFCVLCGFSAARFDRLSLCQTLNLCAIFLFYVCTKHGQPSWWFIWGLLISQHIFQNHSL